LALAAGVNEVEESFFAMFLYIRFRVGGKAEKARGSRKALAEQIARLGIGSGAVAVIVALLLAVPLLGGDELLM
jgi:hypothetical protein